MAKPIEERLNGHPELKARMLALLALAESGIESADEVEERTVQGVRSLGHQVIRDWAEQQERKKTKSARDAMGPGLELKGKKNSAGPRPSERSPSGNRSSDSPKVGYGARSVSRRG